MYFVKKCLIRGFFGMGNFWVRDNDVMCCVGREKNPRGGQNPRKARGLGTPRGRRVEKTLGCLYSTTRKL